MRHVLKDLQEGTCVLFASEWLPRSDTRSDILHRHELIHIAPVHDLADTRRKRACLECAKARERCTKGVPCSRCATRSLHCAYPEGKSEALSSSAGVGLPSGTGQQYDTCSLSPGRGDHLGSGLPASSPISTYEPQMFRSIDVVDPYRPPSDTTLVPGTLTEGVMTAVYTNSSISTSSLPDTASLPNVYDPMKYYSISQRFSPPPQHSEYSPAMTSPVSWISTETVDVMYEPPIALSIGGSVQYTGFPTTLSDDHHTEVAPISVGSYTTFPWTTATKSMDRNKIYPRCMPVEPDTAQFNTFTSLSQMGNSSAVSQYSDDTVTPTFPWADSFIHHFPRTRIPQNTCMSQGQCTSAPNKQVQFWIPPLDNLSTGEDEEGELSELHLVSRDTYATIKQRFEELCLTSEGDQTSFISSDLPSLDHINYFVNLYFQHFDPIMPVIHSQQRDLATFWPLPLALSAVGSQYSHRTEFSLCAGPLHEFLRRALAAELDSGKWAQHVMPLAQALVLSQIGALYGSIPYSSALARARHRALTEIVETFGLLRSTTDYDIQGSVEVRWNAWLADEAKRRLGYSIWVSESYLDTSYMTNPIISLLTRCQLTISGSAHFCVLTTCNVNSLMQPYGLHRQHHNGWRDSRYLDVSWSHNTIMTVD